MIVMPMIPNFSVALVSDNYYIRLYGIIILLPPGLRQVSGLSIHRIHSRPTQKPRNGKYISGIHDVAARQPFST